MIILSALALTSCAPSETYVDTTVNIPNQPSNVINAGRVITLPSGTLTKKQTNELIIALRESELKNARAVNSSKAFHKKLQLIYGSGKK